MRKSIKFFAMLIMASALAFSFTSCDDDPVEPTNQTPTGSTPGTDPGTNPDPDPDPDEVDTFFVNTSWTSSVENIFTYQGVTMNVTLDASLDFMAGMKGEMFQEAFITVPSMPAANQEANFSYNFTYVVRGNTIIITYEYEDEETGEMVTDSSNLIYNPDDETITYNLAEEDPEIVQVLGTGVLIFTKVQ